VHGKTWGLRGPTPVVERPGQRRSVVCCLCGDGAGAFWFCVFEGALNGEQFVELLKQMMHRRRKSVHLILGNSPAHERAIVGEYVVSTEGG